VLVILGDDFNWDDLATVQAPSIAALAARGMTFRNGYVFPVCSLTRYSLVFGQLPRRDGIGENVSADPPDADHPAPTLGLPTLPTTCGLTPQGVLRTALIGKWHLGTTPLYDGDPVPDGTLDLGAWSPILHGFDAFLAGTMANLPLGGGDYFHWRRVDDGVYSTSDVYAPEAQLEAFRSWWQLGARRLCVLAPNLAHAPLQTPPADWLPSGYPPPRNARQRLEAMLTAFDRMVAGVLAEVDLARTYVFLLADNGTQPGIALTPCGPDATFDGCTKTTVWQGGVHVPFFVAGPGIAPGSATDAPVSSTDLLATIAELLGVPPAGQDSISFAPVLFDPAARTRRYVFTEIFGEFEDLFGNLVFRAESAAIGERYKLRRLDDAEFLFDLASDPREMQHLDLADPALAPTLAELRAVLDDPLDRTRQEN
jgi:arylsulfatase A-like enzyme